MIADRDMLVVGQQRLVGAKLSADIGGMMNADIEIGVVTDRAGQMHGRAGPGPQMRFDHAARRLIRQQARQPAPQCAGILGATREPVVEHRLGQGISPCLVEQPRLHHTPHVDDPIADRDADARA